ncbi:MAG: rhodanese-like domain-containing protein [Candidatus Sericytochromatia bacterium]|nr:rhodanese-like domain-containing protein [Candidatus Sericytochromatia bacterium]
MARAFPGLVALATVVMGTPALATADTPRPAAAPVASGFTGQVLAEPPTIGTDELRARLKGGADLYLVDVRSAEGFEQEHLPGAHSLPYAQVDTGQARLPRDKTLVLYCA